MGVILYDATQFVTRIRQLVSTRFCNEDSARLTQYTTEAVTQMGLMTRSPGVGKIDKQRASTPQK